MNADKNRTSVFIGAYGRSSAVNGAIPLWMNSSSSSKRSGPTACRSSRRRRRGTAAAARWPFKVDLDNDEAFIPAIGNPDDRHLIVAGGSGSPSRHVMHGITIASRTLSRVYTA
jgi:hypothetical protein